MKKLEKKETKELVIKQQDNKNCIDKKCPFHGSLKLRGMSFVGTVLKKDAYRSATVVWERLFFLPKYERYERRKSKVRVHNPECINAQIGNKVKITETRPISKTKNFVIVEVMK